MADSVEALKRDMIGVRTGRASTGLVDNLRVDYFGTEMPLNQLAQISVGDARMLVIQPWDKNAVDPIAKAIQNSDLSISPNIDGQIIRLNLPPLTEERRKLLVRKVGALAEEAKTAIRQIRRDANDEFKKLQKGGKVSEDVAHRSTDEVQKITDRHTGSIDEICKHKEKELMEI